MCLDPAKCPARWVCNIVDRGQEIPAWLEIGPPFEVNPACPLDWLIAEGYVGLYRREDFKTVEEFSEAIKRVAEEVSCFDDLEIYGYEK